MKKILSIFLTIILLLSSTSQVLAESTPSPKEEVVYGILNLDGSVNNLYVVNIFDGGKIIDYGNYSDLRNLTTSEKIDKNGDKIKINTSSDKLYYQGALETKALPWDIVIKYFLDNNEISGNDLGGKSGMLKIHISIKQNNQVNNSFFNNYALQVALSLDNRLCSNIESDNVTIAEVGNKKQLTYTVLPGMGADIVVTAKVHDFEMDPISINGIRLTLNMNIDISEFKNQIAQITNAIKELDVGAEELLDGVNQLSNGMQIYINGLNTFKNGLVQLSTGTEKLNSGALLIKNGLSDLTEQNDALLNGAMAIQQATFDSVNLQLRSMGLDIPLLTPENYSSILSAIPNLSAVKKQLDEILQFTQGLKSYLNGVSGLNIGASELVKGISEFKSSSSTMVASANELYNACVELNTGIKKLRDGLDAYKEGTKNLREGTSDIDTVIDKKISELLGSISGSNDKTESFVSEKNTNVSSVQFALKTNAIKSSKVQESINSKPVKLSFWKRLLKLFGLYKNE